MGIFLLNIHFPPMVTDALLELMKYILIILDTEEF